MLRGLEKMDRDELSGAATMLGINPAREGLGDEEALRQRLLGWMSQRLGLPGDSSAQQIERSALEWLAGQTDLKPDPAEPSNELEDRLWEHVTEDASKHLIPVWRIASCMASLGPPAALNEEIQLLDKVAERIFPSGKTRDEMRKGWEVFCSRPVMVASGLLEDLKPELEQVARHPELITPTLVLSLVVAMADAKYEMEESKLFMMVAKELGLTEQAAESVQEQVSRAFWDARRELNTEVLGEHKASLMAAHKTLETSGALKSLLSEVQSGYLEHLHHSLLRDPDFQRGLKAWKRAPYLWPIGFAVGVVMYFRHRLHPEENRGMSALMYHAYARQQAT